jgi:DNA-binding transcriptional regulator YdaS (Cro superfamily)
MKGLNKAINYFGSQAALAEAVGVVPMAVSQWLKRGLPLERCWDIEAATGGKVTKADLRPDRFTNQ